MDKLIIGVPAYMRKLIKLFLFTNIILLFSILFTIVFYPTPRLNHPYEVTINNENSNKIFSLVRGEFSEYVPLEQISEEMKTTIIAIEDRTFYKHKGLDYRRIAKAALKNLFSLSIKEGASTITQQLARIIYLNNSKKVSRKLHETLIAKKLEANYSKDKILELYLNSVYFAHNIYGIKCASNYYFNKEPIELDYSESAILVGIINSPNQNAPDISMENCKKKQKSILYNLFHNNIITIDQYYKELRKTHDFKYEYNKNSDSLFYYYEGVLNQASKKGITKNINYQNGLNFDTFLDVSIQSYIEEVLKKYSLVSDEDVSIVVMKPNSGKIISLIGGKSYSSSKFNRALYAKRQIGSCIKPFLYTLGLEKGMTPLSEFTSEKTTFHIKGVGDYSPKNAGDIYANRNINMIEAISLSDNIYATKTTLLLGSSTLAEKINDFGIEVENVNPTLGLGTLELSPLELCSMYNCLASNGNFYSPSFFLKAYQNNGKELYEHKFKRKRIFSEESSIKMSYMLRSPLDKAFISYKTPSMISFPLDGYFACKTGTTDSSNWVCGYNPNYTLCVYVGTDKNEPLKNTYFAKSIFQNIANFLIKKEKSIFYNSNNLSSITFVNKKNNTTSFTYYQ